MDPFVLIIVGGVGALVVALVLLGKYYPGTGADVLDWQPTRSLETEAELELDDVQQMLDAQNERRRRTGRPELTEDQVRARVAAEQREEAEIRARARRELGLHDED
jgi:hypothetical protein